MKALRWMTPWALILACSAESTPGVTPQAVTETGYLSCAPAGDACGPQATCLNAAGLSATDDHDGAGDERPPDQDGTPDRKRTIGVRHGMSSACRRYESPRVNRIPQQVPACGSGGMYCI